MKLGIVGLPQRGQKYTIQCNYKKAGRSRYYPFCTIRTKCRRVTVPMNASKPLHEIYNSKKTIYTTIEFSAISPAWWARFPKVKDWEQIPRPHQEVAAIVHVVRCFENDNIVHVDGKSTRCPILKPSNTELNLLRHGSFGTTHRQNHKEPQRRQIPPKGTGSSDQDQRFPGRR